MEKYNFQEIEKRWQEGWKTSGIYRAVDGSPKRKFYALIEFPYPSSDGLHVGHVRSYTALDALARKRRMEGYNVLYPIGWDAFGLPTENYAVKTGIHPALVTTQNTDTFRRQLQSLGFSFDWEREVNTTDPAYYRWTQWIFVQLFKKGLAYKATTTINWCPSCKIGLANEEVVGGKCERCGTPVEARRKEQWMLRITAYAEKLLDGLNGVDFLPRIKDQQVNWIGKSEGAKIKFKVTSPQFEVTELEVFTTRPDTLFGATFMVISPELAKTWMDGGRSGPEGLAPKGWQASEEVRAYITDAILRRATADPEAPEKDPSTGSGLAKTGVESGISVVNPANQEEIPVWISDYVLAGYGTGAIMAVPAHDDRDYEFAQKYELPIITVVAGGLEAADAAHVGEGTLMNSGKFDGMDSESAKQAIIAAVNGERETQYHLRDWVFSRQRYWGEPIPMVHCDACSLRDPRGQGWVSVPESELPVKLPEIQEFRPRDDGESPLASIESWVTTICPVCGGPARRETDVMPNWAGSSWYFLRYIDPANDRALADPEKLTYWLPVDWYNGGMEHTTLHLLYSRFWNIFLHDIGAVPVSEPYAKRTSHGMILGTGGVKMSKSKGNVVNPDDIVSKYGADALRLYELFIGPFDQAIPWDEQGIEGVRRFLDRVWRLYQTEASGEKQVTNDTNDHLNRLVHKTVKKISDDIETMGYNTAISALMILLNEMEGNDRQPTTDNRRTFLKLLAPFAPHITEELWSRMNLKLETKNVKQELKSIHLEPWPAYDPALLVDETASLAVQVNGKVRATLTAPRGADQAAVEALARAEANVSKYLTGEPKKVIFVPDRLINFVV